MDPAHRGRLLGILRPFGEAFAAQLGAEIVARVDTVDVRLWTIRLLDQEMSVVYSDYPNGISLEATDAASSSLSSDYIPFCWRRPRRMGCSAGRRGATTNAPIRVALWSTMLAAFEASSCGRDSVEKGSGAAAPSANSAASTSALSAASVNVELPSFAIPSTIPSIRATNPGAIPPDPFAVEREMLVRHLSGANKRPLARSPEAFAKSMSGTVGCGEARCVAGREVCVVSAQAEYPIHCEPIDEWLHHATPRPKAGFPPLAGLTACESSANCSSGSVCCLHELGAAEVQVLACHASVNECRDRQEACQEEAGVSCRTPGTRCAESRSVAR